MKDLTDLTKPDLTARVAIWIIAGVAIIWLAATAKDVLAPMVLGLVLGVVGAPLADRMDRLGLPRSVVATAMMTAALAAIVLLMLALGPAFSDLLDQLPRIQFEVQEWLTELRELTRGLEQMSAQISDAPPSDADTEALPTVSDALWMAPNLGAQLLIIVGTFFFFTLTRPSIYQSLGHLKPHLVCAEQTVSKYFATVSLINAGLGLAVMAATAALGLPNPHLWGAAAGLLNFFLYLGPIFMVAALTVAGVTLFEGAASLVPPAVYLVLNLVEAQFVTPSLVGKQLDVNPLYVFLAVVFGLWIWGPIGAMVALPLLLWGAAILIPATKGTQTPAPR